MKNRTIITLVLLLVMLNTGIAYCNVPQRFTSDYQINDTIKKYRDGIYEGKSQGIYTDEPYWGIVRLTIKDGSFSEVKYIMRDSALHEPFDGKYERHFAGNPEYIQQSRNDWKGVQVYPEKLKGKRSIESVDAMSGATWSYNIFKATVEDALKNSR